MDDDDNTKCSKDGVDEVDEDDNICAEASMLFCEHDADALDSSFLFNGIDDSGDREEDGDTDNNDDATVSEVF